MGALEYIGEPTEEQIAQWEGEGGNTTKETKSEQKALSHSLGQDFLQERFLKALFAKTIYDKVVWRQTRSFFQESSGVYTEIWETTVSGVLIAFEYHEAAYVVSRFLRNQGLRMGEPTIGIIMFPSKAPHFSLDLSDSETLCLQLYLEIKEQRDRMIRKWHKENTSDDLPSDVIGIAEIMLFLAAKLDMPEIIE